MEINGKLVAIVGSVLLVVTVVLGLVVKSIINKFDKTKKVVDKVADTIKDRVESRLPYVTAGQVLREAGFKYAPKFPESHIFVSGPLPGNNFI